MPSDLKQINARINDAGIETIERLMKKLNMTKAEVIREALAEFSALHDEDPRPFYNTPQHGGKRRLV